MSNGIVVVREETVEHVLAISVFPSKNIDSSGYDSDLIYEFKNDKYAYQSYILTLLRV